MTTTLIILGTILSIFIILLIISVVFTISAIKHHNRWDGNTYDLDDLDLQAKQKMAEEELKSNKSKTGKTGFKDINGRDILAGDFLKDGRKQIGQVFWNGNSYLVKWQTEEGVVIDDCFYNVKIIDVKIIKK